MISSPARPRRSLPWLVLAALLLFGCAAVVVWVAHRPAAQGIATHYFRPYAVGRCERYLARQERAGEFCMGSAGLKTLVPPASLAAQFGNKLWTLELGPAVVQFEVERVRDDRVTPPQYPEDFRVSFVVRGLP
jgi:hypothetical protein